MERMSPSILFRVAAYSVVVSRAFGPVHSNRASMTSCSSSSSVCCTSEEYKAKHPDSADRPKWSALDNRMLRCTVGNDVRDWKDALACFFEHWDGDNGMK